MFGAICGDTIGSTYEFDNTKDYGFELFPKGSSYTDDSVMTLAVAKWLLTDAEHTHGVLLLSGCLFGRMQSRRG